MRRVRILSCLVLFSFVMATVIGGAFIAPAMALSAPTDFEGSVISSSQIKLTWQDNSSDEENYVLRRTGDGSTSEIWLDANVETFTNKNLTENKTYTYRLFAVNDDSENWKEASNSVSKTTDDSSSGSNDDLDAPSLSATVRSTSSIRLTWTNVSNEDGYTLQRKKRSSGTWNEVDADFEAGEVTYTDTGLSSDTTYYYRVRAFNDDGYSDWSSTVSRSTDDSDDSSGDLDAPTSLNAYSYSDDSIRLTWNDNSSDEDGFEIQRRGGLLNLTWVDVDTVSRNVESYIHDDLDEGDTYTYRVRAYNDDDYSSWSDTDSATVGDEDDEDDDDGVPSAPDNLKADGSDDAIYLTWDDNSSNEDGFYVYRKGPDDSSYSKEKTLSENTTDWTDEDVEEDETYYYRVYAYNDDGHSSYDSVSAKASGTIDTPRAPSNLEVQRASSNSFELDWNDNSDNESGFKIERRKSSGSWSEIDRVSANKTSYTDDSSLTENATYYYRVRAYNSYGNSSYCTEDSASTQDLKLNTPTNLKAAVSSNTVNLTWTDNASGETGYRIERKTGSNGIWLEVGRSTSNSAKYTDSLLLPGYTYYYRIRAYNGSSYSSYSSEVAANVGDTKVNTPSDNSGKVLRFYIDKKVYFEGEKLQMMDSAPVIQNGRTLVPIRYVGTPLGATVNWYAADKKVTITMSGKQIELWIGRNQARVNGVNKYIDPTNTKVTPIIISGRTMMPIRFITENLGANITYDSLLKEVKITF